MAEDVTKLVLRVDSKQVGTATRRLDIFIHTAGRATKSTNTLARSYIGLGAALVVVWKAYQALENTIVKVATFEKLNKQLEFLTGSATGAAEELEYLRAVAQENALITEELVGPYVRMSTAMTQLGLKANDARDIFEGVADAVATFGLGADDMNGILVAFSQIASKGSVQAEELRNQLGERVSGAFQLAADAVGKTTKELNKMLEMGELMSSEFLPKFAGELEKTFGGDMVNKTETLGASWRRAGDALTFLQLHMAESANLGFVLSEVLNGAAQAMNMLSSRTNDAGDPMEDLFFSVSNVRDGLVTAAIVAGRFGLLLQTTAKLGEIALLGLTDIITNVLVTSIEGIAMAIELVVNSSTGQIREWVDGILNSAIPMSERMRKSLEGLSEKLDFKIEFDVSALEDAREITGGALNDSLKELDVLSRRAMTFNEDFVNSLGNASLESSETMRLRMGEFSELLQGQLQSGGEDRAAKLQADKITTQYDRLVESLMSEEEAIEESHKRRMETVMAFANQTGTQQAELIDKIEADRDKQRKALQLKQWKTALSSFDDFQDNMLTLSKSGNSDIAAVYKAAAIANTTVKTYESATSAYAAMAGIPVVGPALGTAAAAAAVAAGLANVSAIANQQVGGYAQGGIIPGNSVNGDNLTANVNSGEMILNYSQQKGLLDMANGKSGGGQSETVIQVNNYGNDEIEVTESRLGDKRLIEIAVRTAKAEINAEIRSGSGDHERALQTRDRRAG